MFVKSLIPYAFSCVTPWNDNSSTEQFQIGFGLVRLSTQRFEATVKQNAVRTSTFGSKLITRDNIQSNSANITYNISR